MQNAAKNEEEVKLGTKIRKLGMPKKYCGGQHSTSWAFHSSTSISVE